MKEKIIIIVIAILISCMLFGCVSTLNQIQAETQKEFNQDAIYFIKNHGPKYIEYVENDNNKTVRDKQTIKRQVQNLTLLSEKIEINE